MPIYLFHLGHCPELSFAELAAVNQRFGEPLGGLTLDEGLAYGKCGSAASVLEVCDELGGTIRCAEVLSDEVEMTPTAVAAALQETAWFGESVAQEKRVVMGVSVLGETEHLGGKRKAGGWMHDSAAAIKESLKEAGQSVRFVVPDGQRDGLVLNGGHIQKNKIADRGGELVMWPRSGGAMALARSVWWQPMEEFSSRDYGRPNRDAKSGMLPPKLARMMINLSRTDETQTLLDPFCGSGSLLMEAGLMGLDATGIDLSEKAIRDTHRNLKWLNDQGTIEARLRAVVGDAQQLHTLCEPMYFDACATEPDLGPPLRKPMPVERYDEVAKRLTALYRRALGEIRTVVKPGARVVFLAPRIRIEGRDKPGQLFFLADLKLQGYTVLDPMNGFVPADGRTTLVYSRPRQQVQREIFVLQA